MLRSNLSRLSLSLVLATTACTGTDDATITDDALTSSDSAFPEKPSSSTPAKSGSTKAPPSDDRTGTTSQAPGAPLGAAVVRVHVRATQAVVKHAPGTAGQTPSYQRMAFTSLTLYSDESDATGYEVYDLGAAGVECGLDDGDDTVLATLPIGTLKAGRYKYARVGVAHVRFGVATTLHNVGYAVGGKYDDVEVLSDGAVVDGKARAKGWYRATFSAPGIAPTSVEGDGAPLPLQAETGNSIRLEKGGRGMVYAFPIDLTIDPSINADVDAMFELNTHENFRWQDAAWTGYRTNVFDSTPFTFETVVSFGANRASLHFATPTP